jgi:hypothetical protein
MKIGYKFKRSSIIILLAFIVISASIAEPSNQWFSTETEHFTFVYRIKDEQAVKELVYFSEDAYKLVTAYFDSYPDKIKCIVNGDVDTANGSSQGFPSLIELYVASPTTPWFGSKTENWLKFVFIHELTHYVHLLSEKGPVASLSRIFGDETKWLNRVFLYTGWMVEGITTNLETIFTNGGRGRNPYFEMIWKAMIMEGRLFSADQANYSSAFPPGGDRIYVAGYMLVHYLMEKFGTDVFARIHDEYIRFPFLGPTKAIISVTGESVPEIFAGMKKYYEDKYEHDKTIPGGKRITTDAIGNYYLPIVTDKGLILYRNTLEKQSGVIIYDPVNKKEELLFEADLHDEASLTADKSGNTIVFSSDAFDYTRQPESICADLYLYESTGGNITRITRGAHLYHPVLSGDGKRLFAVQSTGSYSRLVEVDRKTGELSLLYSSKESTVYNPVVSPDGKSLVFVKNVRGMQDIYIMDLDSPRLKLSDGPIPESYNEAIQNKGNSGQQGSAINDDERYADSLRGAHPLFVTDFDGDYYPSFIDNDTVLFTSDRDGSLKLYSYSIGSRALSLVEEDPVGVVSGIVAHDSLVYSSYSADGYCLKQVPLSQLNPKKIAIPESVEPIAPFAWKNIDTRNEYIDLPVPLFWFPYPSIDLFSPTGLDVGIGIYSTARSFLHRSSMTLNAAFYPKYMQPRVSFFWNYNFEPVVLSFSLKQVFSDDPSRDPEFIQQTRSVVELDLPLLDDNELTLWRSVVLSAGFSGQYSLFDASPFPFFNAGKPGFPEQDRFVSCFSKLGFSLIKERSMYDFFAPLALSSSIRADVPLPVFPGTPSGVMLTFDLAGNLPSVVPHQVLSPGVVVTYATRDLDVFENDIRIDTNVDYLFPIALLDNPIIFGWSFLSSYAGLFWNYGFEYSFGGSAVLPDNLMTVGAEVVVTFGYGGVQIPFIAGIEVGFDPGSPNWSTVMKNTRFFVTFGAGLFENQRNRDCESLPGIGIVRIKK